MCHCNIFVTSELSSAQFRNTVYEPILPLRLLLLRETNPDSFAIANTFMDHDEGREGVAKVQPVGTTLPPNALGLALGVDFSTQKLIFHAKLLFKGVDCHFY